MGRNLLRSGPARGEQLRGPGVRQLALGLAQLAVDGGAQHGMGEREPAPGTQDVGPRERRRGASRPRPARARRARTQSPGPPRRPAPRRRGRGPPPARPRRPSRWSTWRESVSGPSSRTRAAAVAVGSMPSATSACTSSPSRSGLPPHEACTASRNSGAGSAASLSPRSSATASTLSTRRAHDRPERLRLELREDRGVRAGLPLAGGGRHDHRQALEPAGQVGQEAQRGRVAPVEVVDGHQHRRPFRKVGGQPEQPVKCRERDVLRGGRRVGAVGERDERRGEGGRAAQQRGALVRGRLGQPGLEQLADHAVREVALELAPAGAQDLESEALGALARLPEQACLADARRPLEQQQGPVAVPRPRQQPVHQLQLGIPLQQRGRDV